MKIELVSIKDITIGDKKKFTLKEAIVLSNRNKKIDIYFNVKDKKLPKIVIPKT